MSSWKKRTVFLVLAGGKSTRMKSACSKALLPLGGVPVLAHVLRACVAAASQDNKIAVVVPKEQSALFQKTLENFVPVQEMAWIEQEEALGTAHAVWTALESEHPFLKEASSLCVLPADIPLLTADILEAFLEGRSKRSVCVRLLSTCMQDPTGYGRVVRRGKKGAVLRVVEEKDATLREKAISEVATGIYWIRIPFLRTALRRLSANNQQAEFYLPDVVQMASRKKALDVFFWEEEKAFWGTNTPLEWERAQKEWFLRQAKKWALAGVRFWDIQSVWIEEGVKLEEDVEIGPQVFLKGKSHIQQGVRIGMGCVLDDVVVQEKALLREYVVASQAVIQKEAQVGPFVHLRPGTVVGERVRVGNFVELKNTSLGEETKVSHLSYLGDATVGKRVNIGCGFITCNYDGRMRNGKRKHPTVIEDDVFMGSDCQAIAPIRIRKGAYVASGTTLTKDIEEDALAIARAPLVQKAGYAKKLLGRSKREEEDKKEKTSQKSHVQKESL